MHKKRVTFFQLRLYILYYREWKKFLTFLSYVCAQQQCCSFRIRKDFLLDMYIIKQSEKNVKIFPKYQLHSIFPQDYSLHFGCKYFWNPTWCKYAFWYLACPLMWDRSILTNFFFPCRKSKGQENEISSSDTVVLSCGSLHV